jgi:hypothetical protein
MILTQWHTSNCVISVDLSPTRCEEACPNERSNSVFIGRTPTISVQGINVILRLDIAITFRPLESQIIVSWTAFYTTVQIDVRDKTGVYKFCKKNVEATSKL